MERKKLEKAIFNIDEWYALSRNDTGNFESTKEQDEASLTLIKSALEKQIPMKPIHYPHKYGWWDCPRCNYFIPEDSEIKYCQHCGQAIDWGDEEE